MKTILFTLLFFFPLFLSAQELYFPPINSDEWETLDPATLNWCPERIDSLTQFLADKNTKAFIILKDGKIVLENYFDDFTQDSVWYWASAGKTLTAFLTGMAQDMNMLNINDPTSDYLGQGWTSLDSTQEAQITIRHQLSMSTGLDDASGNADCTDPECLLFLADPDNRWAYHNAPYTLLGSVIEEALGQSLNQIVANQMNARTGLTGLYIPVGYNKVFFSKPRSMARFGLLMLNNGDWDGDQLITDQNYMYDMVNTSQDFNLSYGYLWWLNGKGSYMLPTLQNIFESDLIPAAPSDTYAALGKNDQKIYVTPSQNMVVIRMGNSAGQPLFALSSFDNELWEYINALECTPSSLIDLHQNNAWSLFPNPANDFIQIESKSGLEILEISIFDGSGRLVKREMNGKKLDVEELPIGIYAARIRTEWGRLTKTFAKL